MLTEKIDTAVDEIGALGHKVSPEVWERLRLIRLQLQGIREIAGNLEMAAIVAQVALQAKDAEPRELKSVTIQ